MKMRTSVLWHFAMQSLYKTNAGFPAEAQMNTRYVPIWPTPEESGPKPR